MRTYCYIFFFLCFFSCSEDHSIIRAFSYISDEVEIKNEKFKYRAIIYENRNDTYTIHITEKNVEGPIDEFKIIDVNNLKSKNCEGDHICYFNQYDFSEMVKFRLTESALYWYSDNGIIILWPKKINE